MIKWKIIYKYEAGLKEQWIHEIDKTELRRINIEIIGFFGVLLAPNMGKKYYVWWFVTMTTSRPTVN